MVNDDWDPAVLVLREMMPGGSERLTATFELDDGYSEIVVVSLRADGELERLQLDPELGIKLSSALLRLRHKLFENSGNKLSGCELVLNADDTFKYSLDYAGP